ncbi:MAG: hypothetical protein RI911_774 [Candidatus Parcubacteria bacterium]|jgi:hypothetical protein
MNMFKPTKVKNVTEYLKAIEGERGEDVRALHAFIQKTVPKLKVHFPYNMIGYGTFPYKNYKKEIVQWPIIALASQKNYISLYVCCSVDGKYLSEEYKKDLGKVSVGKSCIRFRKLTDLNLETVKKILKDAEKRPGLL